MYTWKERRKKLHMSQECLARKLHVERSTVAKWESGTLPRADKLPAIAAALECTIDDLLRDKPYGLL